jgi:hypothetical protein
MYPEAAIKVLFPKNLRDYRVEIANKVSSAFDGSPDARKQSHEQRCALRPLTHWPKRPPIKKEVPLKCTGLVKKTFDEKEALLKCKELD